MIDILKIIENVDKNLEKERLLKLEIIFSSSEYFRKMKLKKLNLYKYVK